MDKEEDIVARLRAPVPMIDFAYGDKMREAADEIEFWRNQFDAVMTALEIIAERMVNPSSSERKE